jgi:hypothetical protein
MGSKKIALSFSTLPSRETLRCPRTIAPDIAFEVATEIDRQRGEESLKQKIDVPPGMTMICAVMPTFAVKNCRSWPHSCVVHIGCVVQKTPAIPRRSAPPNELARNMRQYVFEEKIVGKNRGTSNA